jgi:hypothetical protein
MNPLPNESNQEFLKRIVKELGEHFDVVQLLVQVDNSEQTETFHASYGNMYAIAKQMECWLDRFEEAHIDIEDQED